MIYFNKKFVQIKKEPFFIFKIEDFFDLDFYLDIKKIFHKIDPEKLSLTDNFGKKTIYESELSYKDEIQRKILEKLNQVIYCKDFFNFFIKKTFLANVKTQTNILRKIKYLRYPINNSKKKSFLDFLFSKISVTYSFSYVKNNGGIVPHVDSQRKYISLMLYFPDDEKKEIEYGTTFWESSSPNFTNTHIQDLKKIKKFKSKSKLLYKTQFIPNCLYGFLRNDFSWHSVEPINVDANYIRKSININFFYNN